MQKLFTLFLALAATIGTMSASITVRLNPNSCYDWSVVYLWAWTTDYFGNTTNLFDSWPGIEVNRYSDGWWAYTFDESIKDVNIIWTDGINQTIDITHVTQSTCYALGNTTGKDIYVSIANCSTPASATKIGEYFYNLDSANKTAEVVGSIHYSGIIVIPASVTYNNVTYSVTSIGVSAFSGCTGLTSVTIPNSVTGIGVSAFSGCTGLTSVIIPNSVTNIGVSAFSGCTGLKSVTIPNCVTSIGGSAFEGCKGLTSVTIGNSVQSIDGYAFYNCTGLKSVTLLSDAIVSKTYDFNSNIGTIFGNQVEEYLIGDSVTRIGYSAFYGRKSMTSVTIGNSVQSIDGYAFYNCTGLKSVTLLSDAIVSKAYSSNSNIGTIFGNQVETYILGNEVTNIGMNAFFGCKSLTSIDIPNSVTSIGNQAFYGCTGMTSIEIPNSVTSIGDEAFRDCTGLKAVTIPNSVTSIEDGTLYGCTGLKTVTIPDSVTSIGDAAFKDCKSLASITIPNSVTSIGNNVFNGCSGLKSVILLSDAIVSKAYLFVSNIGTIFGKQVVEYILGEDVTSIGEFAFYDCTSLTTVTIPNSVTSIGECAFYDCKSLTSVTIPNSVTSIGECAFANCSRFTSVTIPNSITSIGYSTFYGCSSLASIAIPNSVTSIGDSAFYSCSGMTSVTIGNSVTSIGERAFANCNSLASITIPNSVTSIGNYAFNGCSGMTSTTISNSVTSIGKSVFYGCSGLTSVTIPNSVTSIGDSAFYSCSGLTSVTIPSSVTSIGNGAFYGCTGLTTIEIPNSVTSIGSFAFSGCTGLKSTTISNSVTSIGKSVFYGCSGLTSVTIPNSVTSIGNYAFNGCSGMTSVTVPNSITSIGEYAFAGCSGITSVNIPDSLTSIEKSVFSGCSGITSITIPNSVQSIDGYAFYNCTGLKSVTLLSDAIVSKAYSSNSNIGTIFGKQVEEYVIGDSVTSIGYSAFYGCSSMIAVTIGNSVKSIDDYAFYNCTSLTSVAIPNGVTSIGFDAFYGCAGLTSVTIPNSVTSIGDQAFYGCTNLPVINNIRYADTYLVRAVDKTLSSYIIKEGTRWIGSGALSGCTSLTSVAIPNGVTSIGFDAFYGCTNLTSIDIPNSVTSIGQSAFESCTGLKSVTIGNSVTNIGYKAFRGCKSLTSVTCLAPTPPVLGENVFGDIKDIQSIPLYVLKASASLYKEKNQWKDFNVKLYDPEYFTITATAQNGIVEGAGTFLEDTTIQLLAIPKEGYIFKKWSDGTTINPRSVSITKNAKYEAEFVKMEIPAGSVYLPYGESFVAEMGRFSIKDVDLGGLDYVWATTRNYGMKASSYTNECHEAESWLISPWISLYNAENVVLSFKHAVKYGTSDYLSVQVYSYAKQSWSSLNNNLKWPADTYLNYVSTSVSLNAYVNDVIKIAFIYNYYGYDSNDCPTWEIDNFSVKGTVTPEQPLPIDVESKETSADVTWLTISNANTYELIIRDKDGNVVCSIIFDAEGHAQSVNHYAPSLDKSSQQAQTNDFAYTVTGLTNNTDYNFILVAKDDDDKVVTTYSGSFRTKGSTQSIEDIHVDSDKPVKVLMDGHIYILRGEHVYDVGGKRVK